MKKIVIKNLHSILYSAFLFLFLIVPASSFADGLAQTLTVGGNPIDIMATGTKVFTSNYVDGTVSIIDTANSNAVSTVTVGSSPEAMTALGSKVYVVNNASASVSIIDTASGNSVSNIQVGTNPYAITALGSKVYVSNSSAGTVTVIDTASANATSTVTVGTTPLAFATIGTKIYVVNNGSNTLTVIDTASANATSTIALGLSQPRGIIAVGTKLYVTERISNAVSIVDTASANATSSVSVGSSPFKLVALGSKIYVANYGTNTVSIIDTGNGNSVSTVTVGIGPEDIMVLGSKVYVTSTGNHAIYSIDTANSNAVSSITTPDITQNLVAVGTNIYTSGGASYVYVIDANTVAAVLTEVSQVAALLNVDNAVYYYTSAFTDNTQSVLVGGGSCPLSGVTATQSSTSTTNEIRFANLQQGSTYTCTLQFQDAALNFSNILNIGPFTRIVDPVVTATTTHESSGRHPERVAAFIATSSPITVNVSFPQITFTIGGSFDVDLSLGSKGAAVTALQKYLNTHGFVIALSGAGSAGNETTVFGPATKAAVMKFQKANKITPPNGNFGPKTRAAANKNK